MYAYMNEDLSAVVKTSGETNIYWNDETISNVSYLTKEEKLAKRIFEFIPGNNNLPEGMQFASSRIEVDAAAGTVTEVIEFKEKVVEVEVAVTTAEEVPK